VVASGIAEVVANNRMAYYSLVALICFFPIMYVTSFDLVQTILTTLALAWCSAVLWWVHYHFQETHNGWSGVFYIVNHLFAIGFWVFLYQK
jgi:hypothetical protein